MIKVKPSKAHGDAKKVRKRPPVEEDTRPWKSKEKSSTKCVAVRRLAPANDRESLASGVIEIWSPCNLEVALETPSEDLVWGESNDELIAELQAMHPAPDGFTYVTGFRSYGTDVHVWNRLKHDGLQASAGQMLAAGKAGHTLDVVYGRGLELLTAAGYTREEASFLCNRSNIRYLPLCDGVVADRTDPRCWVIRKDDDDYAEALASLERSRKRRRRTPDGKIKKTPLVLKIDVIWSFSWELRKDFRERSKMPGFVIFGASGKFKGYVCRRVSKIVEWWVTVLGHHEYRKLEAYKNMMRIWASAANRTRTRTEASGDQRPVNERQMYIKFLDWLDDELAYCRKRRWKFARDPNKAKPKRKRKAG